MAMFGTISFVPLFVQGVIGTSATSSGVVLTPLMLGAVTTTLPLRPDRLAHRPLPAEHADRARSCSAIGMLLLWRMDVNTTNAEAARTMVIAGIGLGIDDADLRALGAELGRARGRWARRPR